MARFGIWQATESIPKRIPSSEIQLEQHLEDWIESDPEFVQSELKIVGRQVGVEGGRIDLLAIDPQSRWIIIEVKRGILRRETIAQIIDYASSIQEMTANELRTKVDQYLQNNDSSLDTLIGEKEAANALDSENRELLLFVVGTGRAPGLERMTNYLADRFQLPITLISFDVFQLPTGEQILVRELTDPDTEPTSSISSPRTTAEEVCSIADGFGIGNGFRKIKATADEIGLYTRVYKTSLMYTPPFQRNRMLYTVWAQPENDGIKMYVSPKAISEFYPITEQKATEFLGEGGYRYLKNNEIDNFNTTVGKLFDSLNIENE
jgi:Holliday junction resolvase-like predicted endonuclease